nr:retrovirus-related Pol polyprotein from transposon TNT 1-94 [Tanacetum cinerariifolium]
SSNAKEVSSDPFNIYGLLDKRTKEVGTTSTTTSIPYPPGFTPVNEIPANIKQDAPEVESDQPPNRSERSNSRVLEEVANSVDRSSSESINNGIKLKEGKVFWARAKELFVWSPSFKEVPEKVMCSDDESVKINEEANSLNNGVEESDSDVVSDTYFGDNGEDQGLEHQHDRGNHVDVTGFVDSGYTKDPDKEAEYMAFTEAVKRAIWLRGHLKELGVELNNVVVNYDNLGAINLSQNHVFHEKTKHINVRYHFIREVLEAKTVKVLKVCIEHNVADALTNMVPRLK